MPVCSLTDLPDELFLEIIAHIDPGDWRTLLALSRTDRRLHCMTTQKLYRTFPGRKPEQFLRTIALPPPLGVPGLDTCVEHVTWVQWAREKGARKSCLPAYERLLLAEKLQRLESEGAVSETSSLAERFLSFSQPDEDPWYLEFFLLLTPHVKSLEVLDTWYWDDHKYWFPTLPANAARLTNLATVTIHGPLRLQNILPLLLLPSLRSLTLVEAIQMRQELGTSFEWELPGFSFIRHLSITPPLLESLTLRRSCIDPIRLVSLIAAMPHLKALTWECCDHELAVDGPHPASSLLLLIRELQRTQTALEYLRLRDHRFLAENDVNMQLLASLTENSQHAANGKVLPNIRHLDIGPFFLGTDSHMHFAPIAALLLPRLETLHMQYGASHDHWRIVRHFLDTFVTILDHHRPLKQAAIVDWPALAGWFPVDEDFSNLQKQLFTKSDVEFMVMYEEVSGEGPLETVEMEDGWLLVQKTDVFKDYLPDRLEDDIAVGESALDSLGVQALSEASLDDLSVGMLSAED